MEGYLCWEEEPKLFQVSVWGTLSTGTGMSPALPS